MADESGATQTQTNSNENTNAGLTPESLQNLMKGIETFTASVNKLNSLAEARRSEVENSKSSQTDEDEEEEEEEEPGEVDLETMSRNKFAEMIVSKTLKAINKQFAKPLSDKVETVDQTVRAQQLSSQINDLSSKNKDYWDWKDEMVQIAKENPGLSPARVYALAKAENPAKAAELSKKYNPGDDNKQQQPKPSFGGLAPGSTTSTKNAKMSTEEALNSAFEEVTAKYGDIFSER